MRNYYEIVDDELFWPWTFLSSSETGLPCIIWVDESSYYEHGNYTLSIKVQLDHSDIDNKDNLASVTMNGEFVKKTLSGKDDQLNADDKMAVRNFVKNNLLPLQFLADEKINIYDFKGKAIKGGSPATQEQICEQIKKLGGEFFFLRNDDKTTGCYAYILTRDKELQCDIVDEIKMVL